MYIPRALLISQRSGGRNSGFDKLRSSPAPLLCHHEPLGRPREQVSPPRERSPMTGPHRLSGSPRAPGVQTPRAGDAPTLLVVCDSVKTVTKALIHHSRVLIPPTSLPEYRLWHSKVNVADTFVVISFCLKIRLP